MRRGWQRLVPDTIVSQLALLIVAAVLLANGIGFLAFVIGQNRPHAHPAETTGRLAALVELLDSTAATDRAALLAKIGDSHPDFALRLAGEAPDRGNKPPPFQHLQNALGPDIRVVEGASPDPSDGRAHLIRLRDGTRLAAREPRPPPPPLGPGLTTWLFTGFSLIGLALWTGWRITRPLQTMTKAAERFQPSATPVPFVQSGPYEIRALASAFNTMQARISELLAEKTNALAAVSHDLRTPITRMRLRVEFMADRQERDRMIHDLDVMDQLTQSALNHLKAVRDGSDREKLDLSSLAHSLADRFQDDGRSFSLEIRARPIVRVRPLDLERALENLVENAFKYGTPPCLRLDQTGQDAVIEVEDHGPGIPESQRDAMLRPFTRGEAARPMSGTGGFGLGLAIARDAIVRQGGTFALLDARPQGLLVRITLPLAQ